MPFVSKESFRATDPWLAENDPLDPDNFNDEIFGSNPIPFTLVALKAHALYGDEGTSAPANLDHVNTATFGTDPVPATLVALKAHAVYGDSGTGAPANGAAANDPAWAAGEFVLLGDNSVATWNGTAWVVATNPRDADWDGTDVVIVGDGTNVEWNGTEWVQFIA